MMNLSRARILVTGACGVTSRAIVRALKLSKHFSNASFIGTDICNNFYGLAEGLYDLVYRVPPPSDDSYTGLMNQICKREHIDLAIVIPELEVMHWSCHRIETRCLLPPPKFCSLAGSKVTLHEALSKFDVVPHFEICTRKILTSPEYVPSFGWPCWVRDHELGSTSGRGSLLARTHEELMAWAVLNPSIQSFMISEFLPGRNYACHLLYHDGKLLKVGVYERLAYLMGRVAPSGISGNISRGRLLNDSRVVDVSTSAVTAICQTTGELMQGMIAVDLRENPQGRPLITEINLRHVACTSAFAVAGHNLAEAQVFATLDMPDRAGPMDGSYPNGNYILRDVDGPALWVTKLEVPSIGNAIAIS